VKDVPAVGRMVVAADEAALLDSGDVSAADTLSLVAPLLATRDVHDLASAVSLIGATQPLVDDAVLPGWRAWVVKQLGAKAAKARAAQGQDQGQILSALGYFTDPALIAKADDLLTSGEFDIFSVGGVLQAQLQDADAAKVVAQFIRDHWDAVSAKLPKLALPY